MIAHAQDFLTGHIYAILLSAAVSFEAVIAFKLVPRRSYGTGTMVIVFPLLASFLIALWTSIPCFVHWFSVSNEFPYLLFYGDHVLQYVLAICTGWVVLMSAGLGSAVSRGLRSWRFRDKTSPLLSQVESTVASENLRPIMDSLSRRAGIDIPEIHVIEVETPLILSVEKGSGSMVVTSKGVLETLSREELEVSLAHEVSHIRNRDRLLKTLASILKLGAPFNLFGYLIEPAICRLREFQADEDAARMTGNPRALISALIKLSETQIFYPRDYTSGGHSLGILGLSLGGILSRHPHIEERIERLLDLEETSSTKASVPIY